MATENPVQTTPAALRGRTVSAMIRTSGLVAARKAQKINPESYSDAEDYSYWLGRLDGIATALAWIQTAPEKPSKDLVTQIATELKVEAGR